MRKYELLYILKHDSAPEKTAAAREKINTVIEQGGGMMINEDVWGKKKLAFEVKKYQKGIFILTHFLSEPAHINEIERNLKLNQEVLRFLTVKLTDKVDMEAEKAVREKWQAKLTSAEEKEEEKKASEPAKTEKSAEEKPEPPVEKPEPPVEKAEDTPTEEPVAPTEEPEAPAEEPEAPTEEPEKPAE